jgi:hypothetical protein
VRWIPGRRGKASGSPAGADRAAAERSLKEWLDARHGIEVFIEPKTAVTGTTMLLVAHDGEFTRRPVPSPVAAAAFARRHTLPFYDAQVVGYPQRMRDYSRRQTIVRRRAERDRLE